MVGDESLPKSGVLLSPNYPSPYPRSYDNTDTIKVTEGKTIRLQFTYFDTKAFGDYVQAVDGDGTLLTRKLTGQLGWVSGFESNSNIVHIKFHTDSSSQHARGWRLEWNEQ